MKDQNLKIKGQKYGVIIIFIVLLLVGCAPKSETKLKIVTVGRGDILAEVSVTGVVEPRTRLEIKPPVAGRVEQILVNEGERVVKGQTLAWLSSSERAALLDASRSQGEKEYQYWQAAIKPAPVVAPLTGFIIKRDVEPGQSITTADPVLVMADQLIVNAQVDETDIGLIKTGQEVNLELDAYPGKKIVGRVEHIAYESEVVNNVTIYEVDVLPKAVPAYFRAGMSATVNFILDKKANVLVIPIKAVVKRAGKALVFLPGKKEPQEIKLGLENSSNVEVVAGLAEGDQVILPTTEMIKAIQQKGVRRGPVNPFSNKK